MNAYILLHHLEYDDRKWSRVVSISICIRMFLFVPVLKKTEEKRISELELEGVKGKYAGQKRSSELVLKRSKENYVG